MYLVKVCFSFNQLTLNILTAKKTSGTMWKTTFVCLFVWPVGDLCTFYIHIFSKSFIQELHHINCSNNSWQYYIWSCLSEYSPSYITSKLLWKRCGGHIWNVILFLLKFWKFQVAQTSIFRWSSSRWSQGLPASTSSDRTIKLYSQRPRVF